METVKFYIIACANNTYRIASTDSRYNLFIDKVHPEGMLMAMEYIADKMRNMYNCDVAFELSYI